MKDMKYFYGLNMIVTVIYTVFVLHYHFNYLNYFYHRYIYLTSVMILNFVALLAQSRTRGSTPRHLLRPRQGSRCIRPRRKAVLHQACGQQLEANVILPRRKP